MPRSNTVFYAQNLVLTILVTFIFVTPASSTWPCRWRTARLSTASQRDTSGAQPVIIRCGPNMRQIMAGSFHGTPRRRPAIPGKGLTAAVARNLQYTVVIQSLLLNRRCGHFSDLCMCSSATGLPLCAVKPYEHSMQMLEGITLPCADTDNASHVAVVRP